MNPAFQPNQQTKQPCPQISEWRFTTSQPFAYPLFTQTPLVPYLRGVKFAYPQLIGEGVTASSHGGVVPFPCDMGMFAQ